MDRELTLGGFAAELNLRSSRAGEHDEGLPAPLHFDKGFPGSSGALLVHRSGTASIYLAGDNVGIKVYEGTANSTATTTTNGDGLDDDDQTNVRRLLHEVEICRHLDGHAPSSVKKRDVLGLKSFRGRPSLHFKWADGATVREWTEARQRHRKQPQLPPTEKDEIIALEQFNVRARMAAAIAKSLSDFHDGGVSHNQLSVDHVILNAKGGEYVATIIDLARASIPASNPNDAAADDEAMRKDLVDLGIVLRFLFTGEDEELSSEQPVSEECLDENPAAQQQPGKRARNRGELHGGARPSARSDRLPQYLRSVISTLLLSGDNRAEAQSATETYSSARDVWIDLRAMVEKSRTFLKPLSPPSSCGGRPQIPAGAFCGRRVEFSMLLKSFHSVVSLGCRSAHSAMAVVSGYPGTGKSCLIRQIEGPLREQNGYFIKGKFGQHGGGPDFVIVAALNAFLESVLEPYATTSESELQSFRERIQCAVGTSGCRVLAESGIPSLRGLMAISDDNNAVRAGRGDQSPMRPASTGPRGANGRFKLLLCQLICALSSSSHPVVLFLDDLQRADETTLDVVQMIMVDPDIEYFLFLGCYRENEVDDSHPLSLAMRSIRGRGVEITSIRLGPIEKECINTLVSETLLLPPTLCQPLSTAVHSKTGGIILFVFNFLTSLAYEGLLWFSLGSQRWEYDINLIRNKDISNDVVQHMTREMTHQSRSTQKGLKIAACLGTSFRGSHFQRGSNMSADGTEKFLELAVQMAFLQRTSVDYYMWVHDQVQQAAYEMIPRTKREGFHVLIGSRLHIKSSPKEKDDLLFAIVGNLNYGLRLICDPKQQIEVAQLNLKAGEKAMKSSSFHSAAKYLKSGLLLLGEDAWEKEYVLVIQLYNAISEALFVIGEFSALRLFAETLFSQAQCFKDKLEVYMNVIRSLNSSGEYREGILLCINVLKQLGEVIPINMTSEIYVKEAEAVREMVESRSQSDLINLPMMVDEQKIAILQFLNYLQPMVFQGLPEIAPLVMFRMMKMTILHGASHVSAYAFACYGVFHVSKPDPDFEEGYKMGRIAKVMMQKTDSNELAPRVNYTLYSFINFWKEPMQACQEKILEIYTCGVLVGDMEYAIYSLSLYSRLALYASGDNLSELEIKVETYIKRAMQCQHDGVVKYLLVLHQLILDLTYSDKSSHYLFRGVAKTDDSLLSDAILNNDMMHRQSLFKKLKYAAVLMNQMDKAVEVYHMSQKHTLKSVGNLSGITTTTFIDGLIAFDSARKHEKDQDKWVLIGENAIHKLKQWTACSRWNFENKLRLLEAEYYFVKGNDAMAMKCYEASIKAATDHRFVHEEGIAYEKAAFYLRQKGEENDALRYYVNAKKCYERWGAVALVNRIQKLIPTLSR